MAPPVVSVTASSPGLEVKGNAETPLAEASAPQL